VEVLTFGKILGHFTPIVPSSAAGFASVALDAGDLLWRKLERSKSLVLLQVGRLDVPLATAFCKTFLLRMLSDSRAGRNPTRVVVPIEEEKKVGRENIFHLFSETLYVPDIHK
jgi:hypothetical protein